MDLVEARYQVLAFQPDRLGAEIAAKVQEIVSALDSRHVVSRIRELDALLSRWVTNHVVMHDLLLSRWVSRDDSLLRRI